MMRKNWTDGQRAMRYETEGKTYMTWNGESVTGYDQSEDKE
jgi:hypothetical protein